MTDQQNETTITSCTLISRIKTGLERLAQLDPRLTEETPLPSK